MCSLSLALQDLKGQARSQANQIRGCEGLKAQAGSGSFRAERPGCEDAILELPKQEHGEAKARRESGGEAGDQGMEAEGYPGELEETC